MSSEDEDEEGEEGAAESVQENKKRRVKEKLIRLGYLPKDEAKIKERLHGLSAWKINECNKLREKNPKFDDPDLNGYMEDFERFKQCLKIFYKECLHENILRAASVLIKVLSRCLEFFIQKANDLHKENLAITNMLEEAKANEAEVHESIIKNLESREKDIREVLEERFKDGREDFLKAAREVEYDATEIEDLSVDGYVKSSAARDACVKQIAHAVMTKVDAELSEALQEMFYTRDEFTKQLEDQVRNLEKETKGDGDTPSTASRFLAQSLIASYDLHLAAPATRKDGFLYSFFREFRRVLRSVFRYGLKEGLGRIFEKRFFVGNSKWKETEAKAILNAINPDKVTRGIIEALKENFTNCHKRFADEIESIISLCKRGETVKDEQRKKIREMAPEVATLEMMAYNVHDAIKFGAPECGAKIGEGAQGKVFACKNIRSPEGKPCVVKVVAMSDERQMKDLMLELHNTRCVQSELMPWLDFSVLHAENRACSSYVGVYMQ